MITRFQKTKKRFKKSFAFPPFIVEIFILFIIGFLAVSNWKIIQKRIEFSYEIEKFENQFQELKKRNQELKAGISQIQTEESLEEIARNQLNLKKPGERTVGFIRKLKEEEKEEKKKKGLWENFLEILSRE